jgi:hypothetical protein
VAIDEGRQPPNQPLAVTAEIDASIEQAKVDIIGFLGTDFDDDQFVDAMSNYFGRIGHLNGFNPPRQAEIVELIEEEAAQEAANGSLDANGIMEEPKEEAGEDEVIHNLPRNEFRWDSL